MAFFCIAALAVNLYLLAAASSGASIAGCGGGPCDELLASRWSSLLGLPVTVFGTLAYVAMLLSFSRRLGFLQVPLLGAVSGAALWFVFVQAVILKKFCPWCMTAHGLGLGIAVLGVRCHSKSGQGAVFRRIVFWAVTAFLGIGLCQVYGPVPETHRIETATTATTSPATGAKRIVTFDGGRLSFDPSASPRLGPADAERVIVEYFDYQCAACRTMAGYLEALVASHPGRIAVLVMPVPLDAACNPGLAAANAHPGSCAIARIALAVWRTRPAAFAGFHKALIAAPSESNARRLALELMGGKQLDSALADPWLDESIRSNIASWRAFSQSTDKLPKLLIRDKRILHGLPSGEVDFLRVMKNELRL